MHGRAPRERTVPLAQQASIGHGPTPTSAARRVHVASARAALPLERESARAVALIFLRTCASKLLVGGRGWHIRTRPCTEEEGRSAGAEGFRRDGPTPTSAARRANAASARAAPPPEGERAVARSRVCTRELRLLVGGRGWHVGTRPCTEGEAVLLAQWASIGHGPTPTSAARRAHVASARAAVPLERESVHAVALFFPLVHAQVSCSLESAAGMSEHGRAPRERAVPLPQWASIGHGPTPTSAARRAHVASARAALPLERESVRAVALIFLRTCASKLLVGDRGWHVGTRPCIGPMGRFAGSVGFRKVWTDSNLRGARTTQARVLRLLLRESVRWRDRMCAHANFVCLLEADARKVKFWRETKNRNFVMSHD